MIKNSFIISALFFAFLLANSDLVLAERSLKSKGGKAKGGKSGSPKLADSETAYKYQYLTDSFFVEVDNIVNEKPTDVDAFYFSRIAPRIASDAVWSIDTPLVKDEFVGIEEILIFWQRLATRDFSNHNWSFYTVTNIGKDVQVEFRYHGIVRSTSTSPFQDIFGIVRVIFNDHDLISDAYVSRSYTIDRG
jgi:hypothetical protein